MTRGLHWLTDEHWVTRSSVMCRGRATSWGPGGHGAGWWLWRVPIYTAAWAPPRANPRHLWVASWMESHLRDSPTWVFVNCRTGRHRAGRRAAGVGTFSRCRHRADTRAECGCHWLATLMGCWLTSPQTFPATPRSPHRHHQEAVPGQVRVFYCLHTMHRKGFSLRNCAKQLH